MRSRRRPRPQRVATLLAAVAALLVAAAPAAAAPAPASCATATAYPGDDAGQEAIATWLARGARAAGLPGELPVMAALVESGVRNLPDAGSGYAGFFQMSIEFFDRGAYAGFATRPALQLRWFTDTAVAVRADRLAAGRPDPLDDERAWGEWIADVERPAAKYRDRYQLRLAEAKALVGDCGDAPPSTDDGVSLWGGTEQPLRRRVRVAVLCPDDCEAAASGALRLPDSGRRFALGSISAPAAGDAKLKLALELPGIAIRAARRALRRGERVRARIDVSVRADGDAVTSLRRVVRLG